MQERCGDTLSLTTEANVRAYGLVSMDKGGINDIWKILPFFESMTMSLCIWFHSCKFYFICRSLDLKDL